MRSFPGEFAGASLKPAVNEFGVGVPRTFPGEFAGASLKQSRLARRHRAAYRSVPRRIRRGLIEAAGLEPQGSPANSPGPH